MLFRSVLFGSATINWDFANDLDIMIVARDRDEIQKIVNVLNLSLFCKESYGKSVDVFAMPADMFYKKLLRGDAHCTIIHSRRIEVRHYGCLKIKINCAISETTNSFSTFPTIQ